MPSLRSQDLQISAAFVVTVTSLAAGLIGWVVGRAESRRWRAGAPGRPSTDIFSGGVAAPAWRSVSEIEERLRSREEKLDELQRDYELDTGLLKQEIRRLNASLSALRDLPPGSTSIRLSGAGAGHEAPLPEDVRGRSVQFSSLEELAGRVPDAGR